MADRATLAQLADAVAAAVTENVPGTTSYRDAVAAAAARAFTRALADPVFAAAIARAFAVDTP